MLKSLTIPICMALGLGLAVSQTNAQVVREGVRRTGEAVVEGGHAVAQGTRNAIDRTGEAARNGIGNTIDAARAQVDRQQRSELQPGVAADVDSNLNARAQAGPIPVEAGAEINSNQQLDYLSQTPHSGDPNGMTAQGEYRAGYRGLDGQATPTGQANYQGRAYRLRHDRTGREFICVNGRAVYLEVQQGGQPQQHQAYKLSEERGQLDYQSSQHQGGAQSGYYAPQGAPPAPPTPIRSNLNSPAPASPSLNADTNISAEQRTELNESADISSNTSADTSADINTQTSNADANTSADADTHSPVDTHEQSSNEKDSSNN